MYFPSVLVGCPVNEVKDYCIEDYLENISRLTYPNKKFYFVDNSANFDYHFDTFICHGFDCDYVNPQGKKNAEYICECQNMIREKAINEDFDYLFFLECDVFPKPEIIEELLAYDADVVACNYFVGQDKFRQLLKMEIEEGSEGILTNRNITQVEGFLEYGTQKSRSNMFGFGATLIRRNILEQFPFNIQGSIHADTYWSIDLHNAGVSVVNHPYIATHKNSKWSRIKDI